MRQLIQSDFAAALAQTLGQCGLPARHLTLEITESLLIGQDSVTEARLREIRELGCQQAQGYWFGRPVPLEQWPG